MVTLCIIILLKGDFAGGYFYGHMLPVIEAPQKEEYVFSQLTDFILEGTGLMGEMLSDAATYPADDTLKKSFVVTPPYIGRIWERFISLVCGQRGPHTRRGVHDEISELAKKCAILWPNGPPKPNERWQCAQNVNPNEYWKTLSQIFRRTVPIPVTSRWYDPVTSNRGV